MPNDYQYIELSFINEPNEIKRQIINTVAITFLLQKGYEPDSLNSYLESTQYGYNASAKPEGKYLLTRITDINEGAVNWETVPYCDCDDGEKYLLKKNDILIARTGGTTGKTFLINEVPSNAIFASYLIRLRANKNCLPEFMSIFLNSYVFWSQISELKSGSAQPNVNAEKLKTLSIPYCSIAVQRKVVAIINDIDREDDLFSLELKEKIENVLSVFANNEEIKNELNQQQTYLQLLRQAILQEAVQGKLIQQDPTDEPAAELLKRIKAEKEKLAKAGKGKKEKELSPITEDEIPFTLPEGWMWVRGDDVAAFIDPQPSHRTPAEVLNGIPYIGMTEVRYDGTIDFDRARKVSIEIFKEHNKRYTLELGDFIIGKIGTIGDPTFLPEPFDYTLSANIILVQPFRNSIDPHFITYYLQSPIAINLLKSQSTNSTHLVFGIKKSRMLLFPLPPIKIQKVIVTKVQQLQQQLSALEAQVQQSREYAQQLLQSVLREAFEQKEKVYETEEQNEISLVAEE